MSDRCSGMAHTNLPHTVLGLISTYWLNAVWAATRRKELGPSMAIQKATQCLDFWERRNASFGLPGSKKSALTFPVVEILGFSCYSR